MTRTSGGRLVAAIVAGLAVLPLSGCLYAQIPEHPPITDVEPTPSEEPTDSPIDQPTGDLPTTMGFADGTALPPSTRVEWGDGFFVDDGWTSTRADDGNGGWAYGTVDGTCTAQFWQGDVTGLSLTPGDDSAGSDALLAYVIGDAETADITPAATTVLLGYGSGSDLSVEARQVVGASGERSWSITARAFTATGHGVYVITDCTGGDIDATFAEVVAKNPLVITG
ncbi:hypothetical protein [Streptomyces sp. AC495_CC817]|uniref:hypothetical protein n=1 Tax=Streptomyces sp. AC495_CC817 TaxID=2823900 RepID=UPI001C27D8E3|nr:hypothetical protein [Streptomyces sp. AC495_CC817]